MEVLSWVCPECHYEGDTRFWPGSREPLEFCPFCLGGHNKKVRIEATGYVMHDGAGKVHLSEDWINASGRANDGSEIYVVRGRTGEHADRTSWAVRAFMKWEDAKAWAIMAEMAAWWFHNRHRDRTDGVHRHGETLATPYDSKIPWIDYNGVKYHVEDVPLEV
jgi:hypothetical protein